MALQQNNNLRANAANVEAAIQTARINNSSLYPNLDFALNANRTEIDNGNNSTSYNTLYTGSFND